MLRRVLVLLVVLAGACSSSNLNTTEDICKDKATQACASDGCIGVQTCIDGKAWGPCECATGGSAGATGSGGQGALGSGGADAGEPDASMDADDDAEREASPDCSLGDCAERVACCERQHASGIAALKNITVQYSGSCTCDSSCEAVCVSSKPPLLTALGCMNCLNANNVGLYYEVIADCSANPSCKALFDCLGICF